MTNTKKYNKKNAKCAPNVEYKDGSCIGNNLLVNMINAYNEESKHKNKPIIDIHKELHKTDPKKFKELALNQLSKYLQTECPDNTHKCWIQQPFINKLEKNIKNELKQFTFRPTGPDGKLTWLNTTNINEIMQQYSKKYPDFIFLGAVPIDFEKLPELEISNLNFKELYDKNIIKIGIVFNLDEHYKSGSHWVAAYIDLKKMQIYFFDSYGIKPEKRIKHFLRKIKKSLRNDIYKNSNIDIEIKYNNIRHQFKNSECGVYSVNFIIRLLNGESFNDIITNITPDDEVNKCRKEYFDNLSD